ALREGINKKFKQDRTRSHIVDVTMKSSEAAEKANELTAVALERHQEQVAIMNAQRERELGQLQARLELDSQMARDTIQLQREELQAAGAREDKKDDAVNELKLSMANVQGTLSDMGSMLKMLAERLPAANGTV
ncbi:hypothetical protein DFH28DRAFT_896303, partial [Melampsora americana]